MAAESVADGAAAVGPELEPESPGYVYGTPGVAVGDDSYCAQRFKSWDPATGTYLGYDGLRHPCP